MRTMRALLSLLVLACGLPAVGAKASQYLSVVSVFGRVAEHKALGYTSSYSVSRRTPSVASP